MTNQNGHGGPPQYGYGGQPAPQYGYGSPPPPAYGYASPPPSAPMGSPTGGGGRPTWLLGVVAGLVVTVVALVAFIVVKNPGWLPGNTPPTTASTAVASAPQSSTARPEPSVVTVTAAPASTAPTAPEQPATTAPAQPTQPQAAAWPPEGSSLCDQWLAVNNVTSCSFAGNVASAYYTYGEGQLSVYSPVTGQWYTMSCYGITGNIVKCTGGSNAVVYVRR